MTEPVIITVREIYNVVVQTGGKVDVLVTQVSTIQQSQVDHEQRIRALERAWWKVSGVAAATAVLVSVVTNVWHIG